jgi:hypothetical protein
MIAHNILAALQARHLLADLCHVTWALIPPPRDICIFPCKAFHSESYKFKMLLQSDNEYQEGSVFVCMSLSHKHKESFVVTCESACSF